jgi:hypothetical protein
MNDWELELKKKYPRLLFHMFTPGRGPIQMFGIECGKGWFNILDQLFAKLEQLPQVPIITQVKEKFGTLRVYVCNTSDAAERCIEEAERQSEVTCEVCGAPGKLNESGWISCLCDTCRDKNERRE